MPENLGFEEIGSLACSGAGLLREGLHRPLGARHLVFGLHVRVGEESFQEHSWASISTLCAGSHRKRMGNVEVVDVYAELSIKSKPLK